MIHSGYTRNLRDGIISMVRCESSFESDQE